MARVKCRVERNESGHVALGENGDASEGRRRRGDGSSIQCPISELNCSASGTLQFPQEGGALDPPWKSEGSKNVQTHHMTPNESHSQ